MTTTSPRRRLGASLMAAALAVGFLAVAAPTASATTDVKQARIAGTDRFATAAAVAKAGFPTGAATVVVASGRKFPDALAGSSLGVPILLTEQATLPSATSNAISDLKATKAIILGGTAAVSDAVKNKIQSLGVSTSRVAGLDRYETAGAIAGTFSAADVAKLSNKPTAIIATGKNFADALAGGPLASSPATGAYPVLLVNDTVPPATKKAITDLGIKQVVILGGTGAVSTPVQTELETETGNQAVRFAGTNRYGTATKVADAAISTFGFAGKEVLLANATTFADALAGGPLGALRGAPVLLTDAVQLNSEPKAWLVSHSSTVATVTALGGTAAVSDSALTAAEKAAETPPATRKNEKYVVTPAGASDAASDGSTTYTAKVGTDTVDIALMPCGFVQTTSAGDTVFANTNANTIADSGADGGSAPDTAETDASISAVGGTPTDPTANNDYVDDATGDASGNVVFVVDGPGGSGSACVVPVVFADANSDDALNVSAANPGVASEGFGTGGSTTFSPAEAGAATFNVEVQRSDDDVNRFVACTLVAGVANPNACVTYFYDTNDTFQLPNGSTSHDPSVFETLLTSGDDVKGTYKPSAADSSTFNLYDDAAPEAPSPSPAAVAANSDGNPEISFFESSRSTVDAYWLYRAVSGATCPTYPTGYQKVGETPDQNPESTPSSTSVLTIADTSNTRTAGTTYCYVIVSFDDGDTGPGTTPKTFTTTSQATSVAPTITSVKASSADDKLSAGDVHEFVFSEPMAESTARSATYTVHGNLVVVTQTIDCSQTSTVVCGLSADGKTMHVHLLSGFTSTLSYPLTITATTNMTDRDATPKSVDATDSKNDTTIEQATLTNTDTSRPAITTVAFGSDAQSCSGWGQDGDVLKLTFGTETVALHVADPNKITQAELQAILGPDGNTSPDLAYNADTVVTGATNGSVLTLTVVKTLAHGVENGDNVNGSTNSYVTDAAGNPQQPATGITLPAAASSC